MSFKDKIFKTNLLGEHLPLAVADERLVETDQVQDKIHPILMILLRIFKTINKFSGGKSGGSRPIVIGLLILALLYVASGLYRVLPDEQGVVLRFGKYVNTTQPGLHYHFPTPFESINPKGYESYRVDVGFRPASDTGRSSGVGNVPEESLMLTGDENIVDINYSVFWVIKDAQKFLFNIQSQLKQSKPI